VQEEIGRDAQRLDTEILETAASATVPLRSATVSYSAPLWQAIHGRAPGWRHAATVIVPRTASASALPVITLSALRSPRERQFSSRMATGSAAAVRFGR